MKAAEAEKAITLVLDMAQRASRAILSVYSTNFTVDYKSAADPVTAADREANAIIVKELAEHFPGVPIVAEESDPSTYEKWHQASAAWFVDPLDGTRDFVKKNGQFAVMIGLAEGGKSSLGVVVLPSIGRSFVGSPEIGAFEIAADGSRKKIHVTSTQNSKGAEMLVSRSRPSVDLETIAAALGITRTRVGSAGLKGIKVACAEADVYAHLEQAGFLWDSCAPEAIVVGAGGTVTDTRGQPINYQSLPLGNESGMVMSNGVLHAAVIAAIVEQVDARTR